MKEPSKDHPTLVSLFTGAGGLDLGLEMAGFRTVSVLDNDARCAETLRTNQRRGIQGPRGREFLAGARIVEASVGDVDRSDLVPPGASASWRPDLLAGGPPCQPFSSAGKQLSLDDPRGRLFEHFVRLAGVLKPRYLLFENVRGIVTARGPTGEPGEVIHLIRAAFEELGYATTFQLLNAADYGCPQRRVRCFMIGASHAELPGFPAPTHGDAQSRASKGRLPWKTLGELLASRPEPEEDELVRPSPRLAAALEVVSPGAGLKSPGARETTRPGGHWGYKQGTFLADPSLPARTVTAASTQDWIRRHDGSLRRLTLRECAALQGFPERWEFSGSRADGFRQVGNAVPSVFGRVIGEVIRQAAERPVPNGTPGSEPFPPSFLTAIAYTRREMHRNGASRALVRAGGGDPHADLKGLGRDGASTALPLFDRS